MFASLFSCSRLQFVWFCQSQDSRWSVLLFNIVHLFLTLFILNVFFSLNVMNIFTCVQQRKLRQSRCFVRLIYSCLVKHSFILLRGTELLIWLSAYLFTNYIPLHATCLSDVQKIYILSKTSLNDLNDPRTRKYMICAGKKKRQNFRRRIIINMFHFTPNASSKTNAQHLRRAVLF